MIWIDYALIGLLAGFLAGYLGIGGGLVLVPALSWLFSQDPAASEFAVHMAVATSLSDRYWRLRCERELASWVPPSRPERVLAERHPT